MQEKTLFLAWHGEDENRLWFPIGRLDADTQESKYRFRYTFGAKQAQKHAGFPMLLEFPELHGDYWSSELFPLFQNRIMPPSRPDFHKYLEVLDLDENADPVEILTVNGGRRLTDTYEVFPKLLKRADGSFVSRFFLHGNRHVPAGAQKRLNDLKSGEALLVAVELNNPRTDLAVMILTTDYEVLGWAPHYLVDDLAVAMAEASGSYKAKVVRVNPQPSPSRQRLLVELSSYWNDHEPMSGEYYHPLVE